MRVVYSQPALRDLERISSFLAEQPNASAQLEVILSAIEILRASPFIGRPVRAALRELVISYGRSGYVALYRVTRTRVEVLGLKHQREAGYGPASV